MAKSWFPIIDSKRCNPDCHICINFCPQKVFCKETNFAVVANPTRCIQGCSSCEKICPKNAISFFRPDFIEIDGSIVGINGIFEAFEKQRFEDAFRIISAKNYFPESVEKKIKDELAKRFHEYKKDCGKSDKA